MRTTDARISAAALSVTLAAVLGVSVGAQQKHLAPGQKLRVEVSFPATAHAGPITGRVFVMIARDVDRNEPRLQIGRTGIPFFGHDVERLAPGQAVTFDESDQGSPLESISEIPPGTYYVQAMVSVYSEFKRADGHVVWLHDDQWEGQRWNRRRAISTARCSVHGRSEGRRVGQAQCGEGHPASRRRPIRLRQALQVREPVAHEVLGRPMYSAPPSSCPATTTRRRFATPSITSRGTSRSGRRTPSTRRTSSRSSGRATASRG